MKALIVVLLTVFARDVSAKRLSVEDFRYIASRSPTVFDTYLHYKDICDSRKPRAMFEANLVVGPTQDVPTTYGDESLTIAGGQVNFCTVPWHWNEQAGLRIGMGGYATNLSYEDETRAQGWGYHQGLMHLAVFDRAAKWDVAVGLYVADEPVTDVVNDELVFARNSSGRSNSTTSVAGFLHGTVPWFGIGGALLIDEKGIRQAKAVSNIWQKDLWRSFGPYVGAFPHLDNYQAGLRLERFRPWQLPITMTSEAAGRWELGEGVTFDHVFLKADLAVFVDNPDRETDFRSEEFTTDFHVRIQVHGSYYNLPDSKHGWGGGGLLELASIGIWMFEGRVALGASYNYYEDIMMLQMSDESMVKMIFTGAL